MERRERTRMSDEERRGEGDPFLWALQATARSEVANCLDPNAGALERDQGPGCLLLSLIRLFRLKNSPKNVCIS